MHDKPIVNCTKCNSSDIAVNNYSAKCLECSYIFLLSDRTRAFPASGYEDTFKDNFIQQYRGYNIYWYDSSINDKRYTFWYSYNDSDYASFIESLDECYLLIDEYIDMKERKDTNTKLSKGV